MLTGKLGAALGGILGVGAFVAAIAAMVFSLIAPFLYLKWRRKKFTTLNSIVSLAIGIVLFVITLRIIGWLISLLQGLAFKEIYGIN